MSALLYLFHAPRAVLTYRRRSTDVNFIASQALVRSKQIAAAAAANGGPSADGEDDTEQDTGTDAMAALERQARAPVGFVASSTGPQGGNISQQQQPAPAANPDAIDIGDDDDD